MGLWAGVDDSDAIVGVLREKLGVGVVRGGGVVVGFGGLTG